MKRKKALVFDDEQSIREVMEEILIEKGYEVTSFASPLEFLSKIPECRDQTCCTCTDLILTDINMPGMDGIEFLKRIEERGCTLGSQYIGVISGYWTDENRDAVEQMGCRVFMKPTSFPEIYDWLDECAA